MEVTSSSALLDEVEAYLNLSRMENGMLKLKLQQVEEIKNIIKREARCYKFAFTLCFGMLVCVGNSLGVVCVWARMYLWNRM